MNISLNWLKEYLKIDLSVEKVCEILTSIGLEVGGYEKFESIRGGLRGLVIGEVKTCEAHPDSDHLHLTTVDLGDGRLTPIVCGAPNVAAGQKVVVATIGTVLYDGDKEFTIKKSKIRGQESEGMICAEDEIGIGHDHAGIIVLPSDARVGMPAAEYYHITTDYTIEIDITPNRVDGASHLGVARDLAAYLQQTQEIHYTLPSVAHFAADSNTAGISIEVQRPEAKLIPYLSAEYKTAYKCLHRRRKHAEPKSCRRTKQYIKCRNANENICWPAVFDNNSHRQYQKCHRCPYHAVPENQTQRHKHHKDIHKPVLVFVYCKDKACQKQSIHNNAPCEQVYEYKYSQAANNCAKLCSAKAHKM